MSDFGGKLRLARERRGISLRQIAASTKISVAVLEALERNDISKLPGGIFSRAFVRSYAIEVGLDPDATVHEFLERFQAEPTASKDVPAAAIPEQESSFESQQRIARVVIVLVLTSVPLIGLVLYFTLRTPRASPNAAPAAAAESSAAQPITEPALPSSPTTATVPSAPIPQPPVGRPAAAPGTTSATTNPSAQTIRLELHPTGDCWIRLTVDGRPAVPRLMHAGETEVHQIRESAVIDVGNAGTFAYSINGRPGKALGAEGEVRTARITRETLAQYIQ